MIAIICFKCMLNAMSKSNEEIPSISREFKFEYAMNELEKLVSTMEDGEIDLDTMMAKYQTGMDLIKLCQKNIDGAEFKLSEISKMNKSTGSE